ncbi:Hypothetical_protein [Hexamita inflata]|uniref:Hypothetical_protein n=1 Tax=Hexamita inflata TaxID=28002 RepID=A0ABP1J9U9_9EUKA
MWRESNIFQIGIRPLDTAPDKPSKIPIFGKYIDQAQEKTLEFITKQIEAVHALLIIQNLNSTDKSVIEYNKKTGVTHQKYTASELEKYLQTEDITLQNPKGNTYLSEEDLCKYADSELVKNNWNAGKYRATTHNCIHFVIELVQKCTNEQENLNKMNQSQIYGPLLTKKFISMECKEIQNQDVLQIFVEQRKKLLNILFQNQKMIDLFVGSRIK